MYLRLENELGVKKADMARLIEEVEKISSDRDAVIERLKLAQIEREA